MKIAIKFSFLLVAALIILGGTIGCDKAPANTAQAGSQTTLSPGKTTTKGDTEKMEKATFAGGCFWGVEAAFRQLKGVSATAVGYMGGHTENPTYKDVCRGDTYHAEVVQVEFDPEKISYATLLETFWNSHNPTTLNRQGPDIGTQYRSVIFTHSPEQEKLARESLQAEQNQPGYKDRPIVTRIQPAETFNLAEDYHQQYLEKRGLSQCHF